MLNSAGEVWMLSGFDKSLKNTLSFVCQPLVTTINEELQQLIVFYVLESQRCSLSKMHYIFIVSTRIACAAAAVAAVNIKLKELSQF